MPRLASLYLPDLAIDRIRRSQRPASPPRRTPRPDGDRILTSPGGGWRPGARWARETGQRDFTIRHDGWGALVTAHRDGNQDVLAAVSPAARAVGLEPGTPLTKARILVPGLDVRAADHRGDAAWLTRLGLFAARRWTPRSALAGADGLWLDLTGVTHLFGGERRMCERILRFCGRLGFNARIAVAGSTGAAHALARFGAEPLILCPSGCEADAIAGMALAALRLEEHALSAARRLGIERIGELIAMPRAPLQRRFGRALLTRLDQALGRAPEPFDPLVPEELPSVLLRFLEPIATAEAIEEAVGEAMRRLCPLLDQAGLGVRRLVLACDRVDGDIQQIAIGTVRATRDGPHLRKLLCAKIEKIEPGFGIEAMRLTALRTEPLAPQPLDGALADTAAPDPAVLVDQLAARLGASRVFRLGAVESDIPERSVRRAGALDEVSGWLPWPRPARLLFPPDPIEYVVAEHPDGGPARFNWRGKAYRVAASDGPERVYGEWWHRADAAAAVRDYFQVEDSEGRRFWIFRKGDPAIPGTGDLSWHLHGVFA